MRLNIKRITITMGIWNTYKGKSHKVNIVEDNIEIMQSHGARFCWFDDNPMIKDEKSEFYETKKDFNDNPQQVLNEDITVVCEDGESITGYVTHFVGEEGWFIIQPGTYPTYNSGMYVEDL
jgi:hypothetical protein